MNTEKNVIVLRGASEFHERLTFTKPAPAEIILSIDSYCNEIVYRLHNCSEDEEFRINAYVAVNGVRSDISDEKAFLEAAKSLSGAESFEFDAYINAHYISAIYNVNPEDDEDDDGTGVVNTWLATGLQRIVNSLKDVTGFEYKRIDFYPNNGEFGYFKIKDCKEVDINHLANKDFPLAVKDTTPWYSYGLGLAYSFEDITDEQAEKVHGIVNNYIPDDQLDYCEECWEDDNSVILCDVQWHTESFVKVSEFLNELNAVVEIPEDKIREYPLVATAFNAWFDMTNFGIIFMHEINGKFVLLGTDF